MNNKEEFSPATYRKTAALVGILFIIGTVAGILSVVFTQPVANADDFLTAAVRDRYIGIENRG